MAKPANSTLSPGQDFIAPADLHFDRENPRFIDLGFTDEADIVRELYDQADVDELIQSILSASYIDFEPLIVLRNSNIVLEGNRRLAALRLITDETLRKKLKISLPAIEDPKPLPEKVRVLLVDHRDDARSFIGFKHINGPFKWDALAKAKYAAKWYESGGDINTISRTLGDNHNTVRRLVNGWFALQQALKDGFDLSQISKKSFAFSHLYTALTRASVRDYLGLNTEDLSAPPQTDPIPAEKRNELQQLMSWLYGQEHKGLRQTFTRFGIGTVRTNDDIPDGLPTSLKDGGIDVIAWRNHPDGMPGKLYLIGQCASGLQWREKSVVEYIRQLHGSWFTQRPAEYSTPAMFIPFPFHHDIDERPGSYLEAVKNRFWHEEPRFGMIFDRLRITHFANACMAFATPHRERVEGTERFDQVVAWVQSTRQTAGLVHA